MLSRDSIRLLAKPSPRWTRRAYSELNSPAAKSFKINGNRLWSDIHYTAQWSEPNATTKAGGLSRLSGSRYDKMARDWFKEQVTSLGARQYTVNGAGSQFATFEGEDAGLAPIAMGSHLDSVATGGRFDGPLGVIGALRGSQKPQGTKDQDICPAGPDQLDERRRCPLLSATRVVDCLRREVSVDAAHESKANDGSGETLGTALQSIGYVGDGPNTFKDFTISAHFEIHVEQATALEREGKPVGCVEGWQNISVFEMTLQGEGGHANTYPMQGRRDSLLGASKVINEIETLAYSNNGYATVTNIQSRPVGSCDIQSCTKIVFCLMHPQSQKLFAMGEEIKARAQAWAKLGGLELEVSRIMHLEPGKFWPEAIDCVKRACGDKGMAADTGTAHDSTMTALVCPSAMVFARAKDGISHCAKEWTSKEYCVEGATVLGKAVLNSADLLRQKQASLDGRSTDQAVVM